MSTSKLIDALVIKLRTDSPLVALTAFSTTNISIVRAKPPVPAKDISLVVSEELSIPSLGAYATFLKDSLICIKPIAKSELTCDNISDRVIDLFDQISGGNVAYYDFSNNFVTINNASTFKVENKKYDDASDRWSKEILVKVTWLPVGCPVVED